MKQNKKKVKKGFTLVELIVVIAIIGVLAMMITPSIMGYVNKAKINKNASNAKNIAVAAQAVNADLTIPLESKTIEGDSTEWKCETKGCGEAGDIKFCTELGNMIKVEKGAAAEIKIGANGEITSVKYKVKGGDYPISTPESGAIADEGGAIWE